MRPLDLRKTASPKMASAKHQTGVVLFITLIALVAMTLAAIALMRSVDTGNVVAGNMAFKQGATLAGDAGTEAAINNWLSPQIVNNEAALYIEDQTQGYYPISPKHTWGGTEIGWDMTGNGDPADPDRTMVNWDFPAAPPCAGVVPVANCKRPSAAVAVTPDTEVKYVIHRLCLLPGDPNSAGNNCSTTATSVAGVSAGAKDYTSKAGLSGTTETPHYRITSRIKGPRNTISYVEAIVHF